MNTFMISRTETFGDNQHKQYHLGLIDEHYFIIDLTNITSYCLENYEDVKHIDNCNMIFYIIFQINIKQVIKNI